MHFMQKNLELLFFVASEVVSASVCAREFIFIITCKIEKIEFPTIRRLEFLNEITVQNQIELRANGALGSK